MKKQEWTAGLTHIDPDLFEQYVKQKDALTEKRKKRSFWLRASAFAACFALTIGVIFASGILKFGNVFPDEEPDDKVTGVLPLDRLLDLHNFSHIIFGDDANTNPEDNAGDERPPVSGDDMQATVKWNGIKVTKALYTGLSNLEADTLIAITAKSLTPVVSSLSNFVYQGKTYSQMRDELEAAEKIRWDLELMKDFTNYYDTYHAEFTGDDLDMFWEKVYSNIDKEFLHENGYVTGGEYPFDTTAISDDLNHYTTLCIQLENDMTQCVKDYREQSAPNIDWSKLAEKGFDVYKNEGTYIAVISIYAMESFADCVKEVCTAEVISDTVFRYATHAELGLEIPGIPCDDAQSSNSGDNADIPQDDVHGAIPDNDAVE